MKSKIIKYLTELEREKDIEILLAVETGSRAWGFPSPDSDYDVRLIYKHKKDWYLSLSGGKDSIEYFLDNNEIDISCWELRKSLRLLWKSNASILERIQSPIIYKADEEFLSGINSLAQSTYSRIATIHHYLSMAKKILEEISEQEQFKLKRLFYALRASVACLWILEREEMPPIQFTKMVKQLDFPYGLKLKIDELTQLKATVDESYLHSGETELFAFMNTCTQRAEIEAAALPGKKSHMSDLDAFFRKTIG